MTTRRAVRERLIWIGRQPAAAPSTEFLGGLEHHLLDAVAAGQGGAVQAPDDLKDRMAWLGEQPVDGPSPEFVARLEQRLVGAKAPVSNLVLLPTRRRTLTRVVSAAAVAVALVVGSAALLGAFSGGGRSLQLGKAVNTTVVLPNGKRVPGHLGLNLPNGAVVSTGTNGRASAGSVDLGPGIQATVNNNRLQLTPTTPPTQHASVPPQVPSVTLPSLPSVPSTLPHLP
jgi:hypothetical protein